MQALGFGVPFLLLFGGIFAVPARDWNHREGRRPICTLDGSDLRTELQNGLFLPVMLKTIFGAWFQEGWLGLCDEL